MAKLFDTTLRDGEQTPGVSLTPKEKLWIARKVDELGVDVIEAGSAITSKGEREGIRKIADEGLEAEICSYTRVLKSDVDAAHECGVESIHLVAPVSELHLKKKLKKNKSEILDSLDEVIPYAKDYGLNVELGAEDASRADQDFVEKIFNRGASLGADRVCYCDTVGVLNPEKTEQNISKLTENIDIPLSIHCHDDFGFAVSNSINALLSGAEQVHVTVNGLGERAGNASLEEVVISGKELYDIGFNANPELLYETSRLVSRLTGVSVSENKAIVGENAFTHESGIHAHGVLNDSATYEPISPDEVGRERKFTLGKHTGRASVKAILKEMGVEADDEQLKEIVSRVKEIGDKGKKVTTADLQTIVETVLKVKKEARAKLEELTVVSGNKVTPTASIKLDYKDQEEITQSGTGTGPVDASIKAVKKAISEIAEIQLEDYKVESITGGTEALVDVSVKLSRKGKIVSARGARTDIIMASVEAMLEGVNKLLMEEENNEGS
ncbi:MAG: Isopropylmalate/homocitrate/citramalate synthase LeuA family [Candidatus Methanohalarchaeum thermophilum]|uniref:Putative (R)-citramalate synthase CimA n=1 Tax=Methanohalarchaeum thermophilum TaxID=1903181 RepID=A0A1Q6DXB0_METT1|nr:MAG: Isopropylmalate/homocitrate/citramalate synthase LeuA family [Candidatus Methanohalarchaeum thermophilum]